MNKNTAVILAGVIFSLVFLLHLMRIIYDINIIIGSMVIPMWASWLGVVIFFILAIWMFRASRT